MKYIVMGSTTHPGGWGISLNRRITCAPKDLEARVLDIFERARNGRKLVGCGVAAVDEAGQVTEWTLGEMFGRLVLEPDEPAAEVPCED